MFDDDANDKYKSTATNNCVLTKQQSKEWEIKIKQKKTEEEQETKKITPKSNIISLIHIHITYV